LRRTTLVFASLPLFIGGLANATTLMYSESTTASGTLGGSTFTNSQVTLTFFGDTANIIDNAGFFSNSVGTIEINISSLGVTADLTDAGAVFDNQPPCFAGFIDNTTSTVILQTFSGVFLTYDLKAPIGPITDSAIINAGASFATDHGAFIINSAGESVFTASAPEPFSIATIALGLAGLAVLNRRKKKSTVVKPNPLRR
jgi:hypothetical protein